MRAAAACLIFLAIGTHASAHRLDEYLQATTFSIEKHRVQAQIRLTPGVAVFPVVITAIDTDDDGVISAREQRTYAQRVLGDLSIAVDGDGLKLQLISASFPKTDAMKEGVGEIQIDFAVDVPRGSAEHKLVFENHHQRPIAMYLVNCLVPPNPEIRITGQNRNYEQSVYQLDYVDGGARWGLPAFAWWSWLGSGVIFLIVRLGVLWRKRRA